MGKILIVEDDPMISEIYQKKFSEAGFEVLAADSGEQGLDLLKREKIDGIMLDLIMPEMDGFEVIRRIRQELGNNTVKIFIFSNLSQKEDQDKAMKLGADGFIVKSAYTPTTLVKEISRLLNQSMESAKNEHQSDKLGKEIAEEKNRPKKKILLIEDEEIFVEMFGNKLKQDGFEVVTAQNGAWGLKEALAGEFDIFIVDMVMPAMTGEEIVDRLKMEEKTKNKPIIVLSASVEEQMGEKMKQKGVNEFFVKTQTVPSELSKKVRDLVGE